MIRPLSRREREIVDLLLQGCDNQEIAQRLGMARRTVKAHFNRLFSRYQIDDTGIKRVKLAVLLYRKELAYRRTSCQVFTELPSLPTPNIAQSSL